MKIGIMAPEESGKTSYLVGLYGTLVHFNNNKLPSEYGINYEWIDKAQKGFLERQYDRLLQEDIGRDRFPEKTQGLHRHKIRVRHKEEGISRDIELIDFPGSLLRGDQDDTNPALNAENVERTLTECDGFIVLLDARYLYMSKFKGPRGLATADIDRVLEKTIEKRVYGSIGVPAALCISKYDCLPREQRGVAYHKIRELFPRFFELNHEHPIFMTGVSLGAGIEEGKDFDPLNLENPLEFCLAMCTLIERDSEQKQADDERDRQYEAEEEIEEIEEAIRKRKNMSFSEILNDRLKHNKINIPRIGGIFGDVVAADIIIGAGIIGAAGEKLLPDQTANSYQKQIDSYRETADRHQRRRESHESKLSESIRIGEEAARRIRDVDNPGIIFYKGKEHHFKRRIGMGFPLEEYMAL